MIFDIAALIFVIIFSLVMMKKGGIGAILSFSGLILSVIVATMLYPVLTEAVYKTPLPENLESIVMEHMSLDKVEDGIAAIDAMPDFVRDAVSIAANDSVENIVTVVAAALTKAIIDIVIFILLIIATKLVIKLLTGALNLTVKLPVLHQLNTLVGFICGVAMSIVIVWIAASFVGIIASSNVTVAQWTEGSKVLELINNI